MSIKLVVWSHINAAHQNISYTIVFVSSLPFESSVSGKACLYLVWWHAQKEGLTFELMSAKTAFIPPSSEGLGLSFFFCMDPGGGGGGAFGAFDDFGFSGCLDSPCNLACVPWAAIALVWVALEPVLKWSSCCNLLKLWLGILVAFTELACKSPVSLSVELVLNITCQMHSIYVHSDIQNGSAIYSKNNFF